MASNLDFEIVSTDTAQYNTNDFSATKSACLLQGNGLR